MPTSNKGNKYRFSETRIKWELSPISINFGTYRSYNPSFTHSDIVLFEYIILCTTWYGQNPFYKTLEHIVRDTRLKRHTINKTLEKFEKKGIISIEQQPKPNPNKFHVNFDVLIPMLQEIYLTAENNSLIADFYSSIAEFCNNSNLKEFTKDKETKKAIADVGASPKKIEEAKKMIGKLEDVYNERRQMKSVTNKKLSPTSLPFDMNTLNLIYQCNEMRGWTAIYNSFIAFADSVIKQEIRPTDTLKYFFACTSQGYPVLDAYLEHFNSAYSKS